MIIVLKKNKEKKDIEKIVERIKEKGWKPVAFEGVERTVIHIHGDVRDDEPEKWKSIDCVEKVMRILKPYKLASKEHHAEQTVVKAGDVSFGNGDFVVIAGPCSIESEEQIMSVANKLKKLGIKIMRASAFKPRTNP